MLPSLFASLIVLIAVPTTFLQRCGAGAADGGNSTMPKLVYSECSTSGNFSSSSPYQANLAQLLATLPSNAVNNSGFSNSTAGSPPDTVFGMAMCQADIPWPGQCYGCLLAASAGVNAACPSSKNGRAGSPGCIVRYSDTPIAGIPNADIAFYTKNSAADVPSTAIVRFEQTRRELFTALSFAASVSPMLLASGNRTFNGTHTMYGLAQCSRDLTGDECSKCITSLLTNIRMTTKVIWSEGVSVTAFSCYIRYDLTPFAFGLYGPGTTNATGIELSVIKGGSLHKQEIIAIGVSISIIVLLLVFIVMRHYQKKWIIASILKLTNLKAFSYGDIRSSTGNFGEERLLGAGGFGQVYKGNFNIDGKDMTLAVKRLINQEAAKGLLDELKTLASLKHMNVVRLVGFCSDEGWFGFGKHGKGLYICNEYLSKGSLESHIIGLANSRPTPLRWSTRYKIIRGICAGLMYLHEYHNNLISHMDLKPSNILLDNEMKLKIADFGLSKTIEKMKTHTYTKTMMGTPGYMAPESVHHRRVGRKCDIYSLGVLIMAIVMGVGPTAYLDPCGVLFISSVRGNFIFEDAQTATSVPKKCRARDRAQLMREAPWLDDDCLDEAEKCIGLAFECVENDPEKRPLASYIHSLLPAVNAASDRHVAIQVMNQPE